MRLVDNSSGALTDGATVNISGGLATGGTTRYSAGSVTLSGTITAVNDAPTSTNLNGDTATWTEGNTTVFLDVGTNATIADVDSADFDGGSLTVHIGTGAVPAEDQLGIDTSGTVTVAAGVVSVGGLAIGTLTSAGGAGGGDLVINFNTANATPTAIQSLVAGDQLCQ